MTSQDHQIEVDDQVFEAIKEAAEPFVDTPNTVLRRLLGVKGRANGSGRQVAARASSGPKISKRKGRRARTGTLLEQAAYFEPILRFLSENGGRAPTREVLDQVGRILADRLTDVDREPIASGKVRWENRTQFARLELVKMGFLNGDSPRGVWAITERGEAFLQGEGNGR